MVYNQSDRSAADVAARLVGLGALGRGAVAAGVPPAAFESSLRAGGGAADGLELPRKGYDARRAAGDLPSWGAAGAGAAPPPRAGPARRARGGPPPPPHPGRHPPF